MKDVKILIALPDSTYFIWQIIVQMNNFEKYGYLKDTIYVVGVKDLNNINPALLELEKTTDAQFYYYLDERSVRYTYPSTLRPHILKKFFKEHSDIAKAFFYIDPDVIFTKKLNFNGLVNNDTWYVSNTKSYLNSEYIKGKGKKLFKKMCVIADIQEDMVINNDNNAGGAQYFLKNTDYNFWERVEFLSEQLYQYMRLSSKAYNPEHPIQAWTADMWAVLWVAWKRGINTKIIKRFDFSWATDPIVKWDECKMFHNAGVFNQTYLFNKTNYSNKLPFDEDFSYVKDTHCSFNYVKEILDTKNNYKKIIKLL